MDTNNATLVSYIQAEQAQGVLRDKIVANLLSKGWTQQDIDDAFTSIENPTAPFVPSPQASLEESKKKEKNIWLVYAGVFLVVGTILLNTVGAFGLLILFAGFAFNIVGFGAERKWLAILILVCYIFVFFLFTVGMVIILNDPVYMEEIMREANATVINFINPR